MYRHYFFCGKYDLIQLHRQSIGTSKFWDIHEKLIETITIFFLKKENNENDMNAHAICFDFCYQPQPSRIGQNSCRTPAVNRSLA